MTRCSCRSHGSFLTAKGLEEAAQRGVDRAHQLAIWGRDGYLDKVVSVSGLRRDETDHVWDDRILDQQYRRFLDEVEVAGVVS